MLLADGILKSSALVRIQVVESLRVRDSTQQLEIKELDPGAGRKLGQIGVTFETSTAKIPYRVWMTVPMKGNGKINRDVCYASCNGKEIPIQFQLDGLMDEFEGSLSLNKRPGLVTEYYKLTFSLPQNFDFLKSDYPPGNYVVSLVANISQND